MDAETGMESSNFVVRAPDGSTQTATLPSTRRRGGGRGGAAAEPGRGAESRSGVDRGDRACGSRRVNRRSKLCAGRASYCHFRVGSDHPPPPQAVGPVERMTACITSSLPISQRHQDVPARHVTDDRAEPEQGLTYSIEHRLIGRCAGIDQQRTTLQLRTTISSAIAVPGPEPEQAGSFAVRGRRKPVMVSRTSPLRTPQSRVGTSRVRCRRADRHQHDLRDVGDLPCQAVPLPHPGGASSNLLTQLEAADSARDPATGLLGPAVEAPPAARPGYSGRCRPSLTTRLERRPPVGTGRLSELPQGGRLGCLLALPQREHEGHRLPPGPAARARQVVAPFMVPAARACARTVMPCRTLCVQPSPVRGRQGCAP